MILFILSSFQMPKTKLGQEIKNYGRKKRKASVSSCSLSPSLDSPEVREFIKTNLSQKVTEVVSEDVTVSTDPYNCLVVKNFLKNPEFLEELRLECDNLKLTQKNNDLYKFHQSASLSDNAGMGKS